jgi:hypothetical protein
VLYTQGFDQLHEVDIITPLQTKSKKQNKLPAYKPHESTELVLFWVDLTLSVTDMLQGVKKYF